MVLDQAFFHALHNQKFYPSKSKGECHISSPSSVTAFIADSICSEVHSFLFGARFRVFVGEACAKARHLVCSIDKDIIPMQEKTRISLH